MVEAFTYWKQALQTSIAQSCKDRKHKFPRWVMGSDGKWDLCYFHTFVLSFGDGAPYMGVDLENILHSEGWFPILGDCCLQIGASAAPTIGWSYILSASGWLQMGEELWIPWSHAHHHTGCDVEDHTSRSYTLNLPAPCCFWGQYVIHWRAQFSETLLILLPLEFTLSESRSQLAVMGKAV